MNRIATLLVPSAALALAAFLPAGDELRFAPEEGSTLTKTFVSEGKMTSEDMRATMNGQPIPPEMMGAVEMTFETNDTFAFSDEYVKLGKGRPEKLKRTIEKGESKFSQKVSGQAGEQEINQEETKERASKLAGKSVMFSWNAEKDEFEKKFHESQGEDELLAKLVEDIDLRGFLPEKAVAEGDTWDIEPKAFNVMMQPGGDLAMESKDADKKDEGGDVGAQFAENLEGKAKATYKGTRDVEGKKCGVIEVKAELESSAETTTTDSPVGEAKVEFQMTMEIEGEILWDLAGGHVHAADLHGTQSGTMKQIAGMEVQGSKRDFIVEIDLTGDIKTTLEVGK